MRKSRHHALLVVAPGKSLLVGDKTSACLAPKCVRVLARDAIVSVMLIKSNSTGVRRVECDLSRRALGYGRSVCIEDLEKGGRRPRICFKREDKFMKTSTDRILTTHTGSLPRSKALSAMLVKREQRKPYDTAAFAAELEHNLDDNVRRQIASGVDIGNDGETPRVGFSTYTTERMTGFGGESKRKPTLDAIKFPGFAEYMSRQIGVADDLAKVWNAPQAVGKLEYDSTLKEAKEETALFQASLKRLGACVHRKFHVRGVARHRLVHNAAFAQQSGVQDRRGLCHGDRERIEEGIRVHRQSRLRASA